MIALLSAGLLAAAVGDWRTRTISNWLNGAIALGAIPFWWSTGLGLWPDVAIQVGVAALVFAIFLVAFAMGQMGGGDVKMLGAVALWLPPMAVFHLVVIMSIAGGVLTLAMLLPARLLRQEGNPEIPYGIAIAFAAFWLIGERFLNHFG
ncbi:MAG TPA: prepilin peptidase [Allosphingosinicella sp.]|nr:prepilin peptidase [Allosphingosinicella sp.]